MFKPKFSLIMATCGRTIKLHRFFSSLESSSYVDCECIVVDQNPDDRLVAVLAQWKDRVSIKHVRSTPGLSRARNVGLQHASGEILGFPDDDCWYSPKLLERTADFFERNPEHSILSAGVRDETGALSGNRWLRSSCKLSTTNLFRTSVGIALFVRRNRATESMRFDDSLGVGSGTPFASGEDTDYVFRLLEAGLRGRFDRSLTVYHARHDMLSGGSDRLRAYSYGCGMGRVIRQRAKLPLLPAFVTFDLLRTMLSILHGKVGPALLCVAHGRGVFAGYKAPLRR
jgi:glycosyltransferase involved in cell wall biosynthesis